MVGIVIVSHSRRLAEGVVELVRGMAGEDVPVAAAAGVDDPDDPLGTDAVRVAEAIREVDRGEGVLVLMDLGSAVLSAETALDLLEGELGERVLLCEAPLVEGAMAAGVQARMGASLEEVAAEARRALDPKAEHLGEEGAQSRGVPEELAPPEGREAVTAELEVANPLGLHARPAARFVEAVARFGAEVRVRNLTTGRGPVSGRSLNALATLGVRQGHRVGVEASGPEAEELVAALRALAREGFGDRPAPPEPEPPRRPPAEAPEGAVVGLAASPGVAVGEAVRLHAPQPEVPEEEGGDPEAEWASLEEALRRAAREIRSARRALLQRTGDEYRAGIFDAHLLALEDEELLGPARRAIFEEGRSAGAAWREAVRRVAEAYRELEDEYQRARAEDVEAVGRRVLMALLGEEAAPAPVLERPGILVAHDLTPGETARFDPARVRGVATAAGSPTSHAAILARSLGIPAVVGVGERLAEVAEGARLVLDGGEGLLFVDPPPELEREYLRRREALREASERARARAGEPARTRDGRRVEVAANVGAPEEVEEALASGAEGIGLLRTEFLFLDRSSVPDEEEQYSAYRAIAEGMGGRPVVLRTLDVGGDKPLPYLPRPEEANPFLGVRGIRLSLEAPDLLRVQLRAAVRVAAEHPLSVMFPMVADLEEFRRARGLLEEAAAEAGVERVAAGVMVETPALALLADRFAPEVAFFSVGTNDLTQYVLAAERGNPHLAGLADHLHPAVLRAIRAVVEAAREGTWVGVCGELAGDPRAAPLLVGLGVDELSMAPAAIPPVKEAIRSVDTEEATRLAEEALRAESAQGVRRLLEAAGR